jgi:hypothetical protein
VTIAKLGWLLAEAVAALGERRVGELRSREIAAWWLTIRPGPSSMAEAKNPR